MPRLALQRGEAAEALVSGVDTFDRHVRPDVLCVRVGAVRLWPVEHLQRWLNESARGMLGADNEKRPTPRERPGAWPTEEKLHEQVALDQSIS